MFWKIEAVRSDTGEDETVEVEAATRADALLIAKGRGLYTHSIEIFTPKNSQPSFQQQINIITPAQNQTQNGAGAYNTALVLSIIGIVAWLLPIAGLPISIIGLCMATRAKALTGKGDLIGILCILELVLSVANAIAGIAYFSRHPLPF